MKIVRYNENMLDACAEFWWSIYEHKPYVHRPDAGQTVNTPLIGPEFFVKHLKNGFNGVYYFIGDVTDDSVILIEDEGKLAGILVCSVEEEICTANILGGYVTWNLRGQKIADCLVSEALERFRKMGLHRITAAPGGGKSMEVESPIHLALLDADFKWQFMPDGTYGFLLGGSVEGFCLQPEIKEKIERLRREGITFERYTSDECQKLQWLDTRRKIPPIGNSICAFIALFDGLVVGKTIEVSTFEDEGSIMCQVAPHVIHSFRGRGIGTVLQHLGTEEVVRHGAQYGWRGASMYGPEHFVYKSVGFKHWYTAFGRMTKYLR